MKAKQPSISPIGFLLLACLAMTVLATSCKDGPPQPNGSNSPTPEPKRVTISAKAKKIEEVILRDALVNEAELTGLPLEELHILRNVVFARHGMQYERPGLGDYFYNCDWYKPDPARTPDSKTNWRGILTANDQKNRDTIRQREKIAEQSSTPSPSKPIPADRPFSPPEEPSRRSSSNTLQIEYRYSHVAICEGARATLGGMLVGEAQLLDLVKGQYYVVREIHYSPGSGDIIYVGQSKFSVAGGMKISEETIRGQKIIEIFRSWPSGGF